MSGRGGPSGQGSPQAAGEPTGERVGGPAIRPVAGSPLSAPPAGAQAPHHPFGGEPREHAPGADASRFIPPGSEETPIPAGFFDPRENEAWFQHLTPREQDHFRRVWMKEQVAQDNRARWDRERLLHSVVECALLFAVGQMLLVDLSFLSLVLGSVVGTVWGFAAHWIRAGRGASILVGFAAMVVLQTLNALLGDAGIDVFSLLLFWLLTIATCISGGMRREAERFGA